MWTLYVKSGTNIPGSNSSIPSPYIRVMWKGIHNLYIGKTPIMKKTRNPVFDQNNQNPISLPVIWGNVLNFQIFQSNRFLPDEMLGDVVVPIADIKPMIDYCLEVNCKFIPDDRCFITVFLKPPAGPYELRPLAGNDKIIHYHLSFNPPIDSIEVAKSVELTLIHGSTEEGEIHVVNTNSKLSGFASYGDELVFTSNGWTPVFETKLSYFSMMYSLGFGSNGDCSVVPCIKSTGQYKGIVSIIVTGSPQFPDEDTKNNWTKVSHIPPNYIGCIHNMSYNLSEPGYYVGGFMLNCINGFLSASMIKYYRLDFPFTLREVGRDFLFMKTLPWTRVKGTIQEPITVEKAIQIHQIGWPTVFMCEATSVFPTYPHDLNLTPFNGNFAPVKKGFLKSNFDGIERHHRITGRFNQLNVHETGEYSILKVTELDDSVRFIVVSLASDKDLSFLGGSYFRMIDLPTKVELFFLDIKLPAKKTVVGVFYRLHDGRWDFKPTPGFVCIVDDSNIDVSELMDYKPQVSE